MKRKKIICLLAFITMLIGVQPLVMKATKEEEKVSSIEVYSYITGKEHDIEENSSVVKERKIFWYLSLKTVCLDRIGQDIQMLLQDNDRKVYGIEITAEKQYVEEIYFILEKYTVAKIVMIDVMVMVYIGIDETNLFGVIVAIRENITEYLFQVFLFVAIKFVLHFYKKYVQISTSGYYIHGDIYSEDNTNQYNGGFIAERRRKQVKILLQLIYNMDTLIASLSQNSDL